MKNIIDINNNAVFNLFLAVITPPTPASKAVSAPVRHSGMRLKQGDVTKLFS